MHKLTNAYECYVFCNKVRDYMIHVLYLCLQKFYGNILVNIGIRKKKGGGGGGGVLLHM